MEVFKTLSQTLMIAFLWTAIFAGMMVVVLVAVTTVWRE